MHKRRKLDESFETEGIRATAVEEIKVQFHCSGVSMTLGTVMGFKRSVKQHRGIESTPAAHRKEKEKVAVPQLKLKSRNSIQARLL